MTKHTVTTAIFVNCQAAVFCKISENLAVPNVDERKNQTIRYVNNNNNNNNNNKKMRFAFPKKKVSLGPDSNRHLLHELRACIPLHHSSVKLYAFKKKHKATKFLFPVLNKAKKKFKLR